jgi:Raf kinase inhibitor-like YbhB/YbcL family protein
VTRLIKHPRRIALAGLACVLLVACDTGDGKTLRAPTGTLPPPTTTTIVPGDGDGEFSLPAENPAENPVSEPAESPVVPASAETGQFGLIAPWVDGGVIDARYTCDGENIAPALSWVAVPPDAVELAIAVVDESISNGPPFIHWVIAGIQPEDISLIEGVVPPGAVQALNFFGDIGWGGPCPPPGEDAHVYRFTVYALNQQVELADATPATDLLAFVEAVSIASADLTGTYRR